MEQLQQEMSQNETAQTDKRVLHRQRVIKGGTLYFNKGFASFQCRVRNINELGALLEMGETTGLPSQFDFCVSGGSKTKPAKLVWKNMERVGISFLK